MRERATPRRIGALAATAGVTVDTLRFYEREGLLPEASRTTGGFRLYPPEMAEKVRFIKQAQEIGFSLREIRELLQPDDCRCSTVRDMLAERLAEVDRRLRDLSSFRKTLQAALERCDSTLSQSKSATCPVVPQLGTRELSRVRRSESSHQR